MPAGVAEESGITFAREQRPESAIHDNGTDTASESVPTATSQSDHHLTYQKYKCING